MKKILSLFIVVSSLVVTTSFGQRYWQRIDVAINFGYATFRMNDLKELQQDQAGYFAPLKGEITNSFPGYLNLGVDAVFYDSTYFVGFVFGHTSTGGRIHYADYSGSVTADQLVRMNYNGVVGALRVASTKVGNIFIGTNLLTYFNKVELKYSETIFDEASTTSNKLQSLNVALGPFLQIHKRFGKFLVKGNLGYEFHLGMDLYYKESDQKYVNSSNEYVKVNADGIRAGIGVGYAVYTRRPKSN